jgi:hypothetical protein
MQFAMFLHHKWPTGIAKSSKVIFRMLNVKSVARRHYQFHCRHWWPGHCIFSPRRRHWLMACIEARTLTIDGSNPARDESNTGIDTHIKPTHAQLKLHFFKTQFSKTLECLCPVSPYMFRSLKADHPQGRMFLCTATCLPCYCSSA